MPRMEHRPANDWFESIVNFQPAGEQRQQIYHHHGDGHGGVAGHTIRGLIVEINHPEQHADGDHKGREARVEDQRLHTPVVEIERKQTQQAENKNRGGEELHQAAARAGSHPEDQRAFQQPGQRDPVLMQFERNRDGKETRPRSHNARRAEGVPLRDARRHGGRWPRRAPRTRRQVRRHRPRLVAGRRFLRFPVANRLPRNRRRR